MTLPRARNAGLVLLTGVLAACGSAPASATRAGVSAAVAVLATPAAALPASPSPSAGLSPAPTPAPLPPPPPPPAAAPLPAAPAPAPMMSQSFVLVAVNDGAARGTVTVTTQPGRAVISIVATGLPPGSTHSVHLHFGNCPSAGSHILVLGTLRADGAGTASLTATVNAAFTGAGHFVIIYVGPAAGPLGACANLG